MDTTATETTTEQEQTGSEATGAGEGRRTEQQAVSAEEHEREVDRYREQFGQEKKRATEAERLLADAQKRLKAIEDEQKPELTRLTEAAGKVPTLEATLQERETRIEALEAIIAEQVAAMTKALPAEHRELIPEGSPEFQLAWLAKAAPKLTKATANGLPPSGGRAPGAVSKPEGPTDEERRQHARLTASRF